MVDGIAGMVHNGIFEGKGDERESTGRTLQSEKGQRQFLASCRQRIQLKRH